MNWLAHLFSFDGRLSRASWRRLHLSFFVLSGLGVCAALFVLTTEAPRPLALVPLAILPLVLLALLSGWTRRLHDVGLHARAEILRHAAVLIISIAPLALLFVSDLPDWTYRAMWTWLAGGVLFSMTLGWQRPEWRLGDETANEFGDPPP